MRPRIDWLDVVIALVGAQLVYVWAAWWS